MKIKDGFELRNVCGENVIVAIGLENIDFSKIISLNETAAYIWNTFVDKEFSIEDATNAILSEYDVKKDVAENDIKSMIEKWKELEIID